ncbi:MAG: hypothetical protein DPW14_07845 [Planctomycetes bacterium]|nr:hypothetical protein [Planctomycetota bacterium]
MDADGASDGDTHQFLRLVRDALIGLEVLLVGLEIGVEGFFLDHRVAKAVCALDVACGQFGHELVRDRNRGIDFLAQGLGRLGHAKPCESANTRNGQASQNEHDHEGDDAAFKHPASTGLGRLIAGRRGILLRKSLGLLPGHGSGSGHWLLLIRWAPS